MAVAVSVNSVDRSSLRRGKQFPSIARRASSRSDSASSTGMPSSTSRIHVPARWKSRGAFSHSADLHVPKYRANAAAYSRLSALAHFFLVDLGLLPRKIRKIVANMFSLSLATGSNSFPKEGTLLLFNSPDGGLKRRVEEACEVI